QEIIAAYPDHYAIGSQGPDIFFYHVTSKTRSVGEAIHEKPLADFLNKNKDWIEQGPRMSPTWAYFFGFLAHFSLDLSVHPYIDRIEQILSLDHMTIERDFDRVILEEEGYDPTAFLSRSILPAPADVSSGIVPAYTPYRGVNAHEIHRALASFRIGQQLFHVDSKKTYALKHRLLDKLGMGEAFGGMLLNPDGYPESIYTTNPVMKELMTLAYPIAYRAVATFTENRDYPAFFQFNFNGR
ncbi:MAG: zinc dependent phospholipase C family protein, partial [Peptoniphilus sp.]